VAEYINREEYCEKYCRCNNEHCDRESCPIWKAPTADVAPVVRGRWIKGPSNPYCSECFVECRDETPFCPNCGVKMDGVDDG
jgi:hypothetical protein